MVHQIDPEILNRCKRKDQNAFKHLVEFYQNYAFRLAFRLVCNQDDARDIVQESFIRVWKHIERYNSDIRFSTWLYKIVCNLCLDQLKMKKRTNKMPIDDLTLATKNLLLDKNYENELINKDLALVIGLLAEELTPKQRMIFTLRDLQDIEIPEIVKILNMSAENIKSNLYYARKNIGEKLVKMNLI